MGAPLALVLFAGLAIGLGVEVFSVMWDTAPEQHVPEHALSRVSSYHVLGSIVDIRSGSSRRDPSPR